MNSILKERKLLIAFFFLILLTLLIGVVGIVQIHGLNRRVEDLGSHHLILEGSVLGMRVSNANYAMEIRGYIFWRNARHQESLPMTEYAERIKDAEKRFNQQLDIYCQNCRSEKQKAWCGQIKLAAEDLFRLGDKITIHAHEDESGGLSKLTQDRFMVFEKRIHELDQFLNDPLGASNLAAIQGQIALAKTDKENAISFLWLCSGSALCLGTLIVILAYRRNVQDRVNRQKILNRIMDVEETERRKLSAAVHDEMGQDLSALKIRLGLIKQKSVNSADDEVKSHLEECKKIADSLLKKSHNIAFLLRPPDLDDIGLIESLEALLIESKHMTGIAYDYPKPENLSVLSPEYSLLFYRITQELLTNMAKYAKASHVELSLVQKSDCVELMFADNGHGFDFAEFLKHPARRRDDKLRLGLVGLKERVELLDGTMRIDSKAGAGTKVTVRLPM